MTSMGGGGLTHMYFAVLLGLLLPSGLQSQTVIDQARVDVWIREAHALVEVHGLGRAGWGLAIALNEVGAPLGLPVIERPNSPAAPSTAESDRRFIDSLLVATPPAEGFATAVRIDRDRGTEFSLANRFLEGLAKQGEFDEVFDFALEIGSPRVATRAVLDATEYPIEQRQSVVREWLRGGRLSEAEQTRLLTSLLWSMFPRDPERVLEEITREENPAVRARTMLGYLVLNSGGIGGRDSLLVAAGMDAAVVVEDSAAREEFLQSYSELCYAIEPDGFPANRPACDERHRSRSESTLRALEFEAGNFKRQGNLASADSVLSVIDSLEPDEPRLLSFAAGLVTGGCHFGRGCLAESLRIRNKWMSRFEAFAEGEGPPADTMRAKLAEMWAADDAGRALRWLEAVEDPELAYFSGYSAAPAAAHTDFWGAIELLRAAVRPDSDVLPMYGGPPSWLYVELKRFGEDALAEEFFLEGVSPLYAATVRLAWVDVLAQNGRAAEGRELAMELLPDWDNETSWMWAHHLVRTFSELGTLEELFRWVEEMPDGTPKAAALIGLAQGTRSLVVPPRSP